MSGLLLSAVVALAGCGASDGPTQSASTPVTSAITSPAPSSSDPGSDRDPVSGELLLDTGGTQVTGLAVAAGAMWAVSYDTATMVRIDPGGNHVGRTISMPGAAVAASLPSGLWVAAYGDPGQLYRIDTDTEAIANTVVVGELCCDLTEGGGLVWALERNGHVVGIDPATAKVAKRFPVHLDLNAHNNVVFAGGYVWVSSDTTRLLRFEPATGKRATFDVGGGVPFLAQDGLLWGASPTELWGLDPATGKVTRRISVPDSMEVMALAIDGRTAWIGMRHPGYVGAVLKLDLTTGKVLREVAVDIPARIVLAFGSVWVADSGTSQVWRIKR